MKIGITGGIGSGKSYVCRLLSESYGITVYDCDSAAKRLMRTSAALRRQLTALIGPDCYLSEAQDPQSSAGPDLSDPQSSVVPALQPPPLNKAAVARFLLASEANAHAIDAIVHPAVFRDFEESGMKWMESAIMYESGANKLVDRIVVVTAPDEVRISRIMLRDGISREKALEWMGRQWPQDEVRRRADYEIINDGQADLKVQMEQLMEALGISSNTVCK